MPGDEYGFTELIKSIVVDCYTFIDFNMIYHNGINSTKIRRKHYVPDK